MIRLTASVAFTVLAAVCADAQSLTVSRGGSRPVRPAPAQNFSGSAQVEMLFEAVDPSYASGGIVTFEPGARTAWHVHPRGQILIVTSGVGRAQRWGDAIEEIRAGDVVRIPAGQKHWHGAAPQSVMTHLAISEHRDGTAVQWMEPVSDEQYGGVVSDRRGPVPQAPPPSAPQPNMPAAGPGTSRPSGPLQQKVAPGLAALTDDVLFGDVWQRQELSPRDRSLVTVTALIATGKVAPLVGHLGRALDNGVQPSEASGLLAHLAIYCGWPSVVAALDAYEQVYTSRKVDTAALSAAVPLRPAQPSDAVRAPASYAALAASAPKFGQLTDIVVFGDVWQRADVSRRDRCLVTIVALAAIGLDDQLEYYLGLARESGLTRTQITEAVTHLGFYTGWGRATAAMAAVARTRGW
jgi:4-carboxymuconolactone decarboxylase